MRSPFLTATWRNLVLLSYEVDPQVLAPYVPPGVQLDPWESRHLITLVGLQFLDTRVLGVPVPFYLSYPQLNLRFYVRRQVNGQWRPGVVFIKQIVPKRLIALVARWKYQEKFVAMSMRHSVVAGPDLDDSKRVSYQWQGPSGWNSLSVAVYGKAEFSSHGSLEDFIAERYYGYNARRDGRTLEYLLEHPRWRIQRVDSPELMCDVAGLYGPEFTGSLGGTPVSAFLAEGSRVVVHRGVRLNTSPE